MIITIHFAVHLAVSFKSLLNQHEGAGVELLYKNTFFYKRYVTRSFHHLRVSGCEIELNNMENFTNNRRLTAVIINNHTEVV